MLKIYFLNINNFWDTYENNANGNIIIIAEKFFDRPYELIKSIIIQLKFHKKIFKIKYFINCLNFNDFIPKTFIP